MTSTTNPPTQAHHDEPCGPLDAVCRGRSVLNNGGQYLLGTGDYRPVQSTTTPTSLVDLPWTDAGSGLGSDCAGFAICWAWKLRRHRPGFNTGPWSSVSDDINCNSALEDAQHKQELFTLPVAGDIKPGDLILYPTFTLAGHTFIGHVGLVEWVPPHWATYDDLTILQCHGPNGFTPGVVHTDASLFHHHDLIWPKDEHKTRIVRPRTRT